MKLLTTAFVLFKVETGQETQVMTELEKIREVKEAHIVYGIYDIIAQLEIVSMEDLKDVTRKKIRRLEKVISTFTMIVL